MRVIGGNSPFSLNPFQRTLLSDIPKPQSSLPSRTMTNKNAKTIWVDEGGEEGTIQKNIASTRAKSPLGKNSKAVPQNSNKDIPQKDESAIPSFQTFLEKRPESSYKYSPQNPIHYNKFSPVFPPMDILGQQDIEKGAYPILSKLGNIQGLGIQGLGIQGLGIQGTGMPDLIDFTSPPASPHGQNVSAFAPSAPPMPPEMLEELIKAEILVPASTPRRELPLLIDRHKTMKGNGDHIIDGSNFYDWGGYSNCYYDLGQGVSKIINDLKPYLEKEGSDPEKPARAFLKKHNVDFTALDTFFTKNSNQFLLNDYTYDNMADLHDMMDALAPVLDKTKKIQKKSETGEVTSEESFEDFLKNLPVPQAEKVALKKPFNETMKEVLTKLPKLGEQYNALINKPSSHYIERVLFDKKSANDVTETLDKLSKTSEAQDPAHRDSLEKLLEGGKKFVQSLQDVIKYVETAHTFKSAHVEVGLEKIHAHYEAFQKEINRIGDDIGAGKFGHLLDTDKSDFVDSYVHLAHNIRDIMNGALGKELGSFLMRDELKKEQEAQNTQAKDTKIASPEEKAQIAEDYKVLSSEEFYKKYLQKLPKPEDMTRPLSDSEIQRPAVFDDSDLRQVQQMSEWADYANKMSQKLKLLDNIGNTVQDLAMLGTSRPDPEYVALARRWRRLSDLLDVAKEVPKCNKMTQQVEQAVLDAQHEYVKGVGTILTGRLKCQTEEANQKVTLDQMVAKGATGLAAKALETELIISKHAEKIFNMFMQIQDMRDMNTWDRIKHLVKSFKW